MGKVYALSDIHGFKSIYDQVKEFIQPEDKVIFLGDAADRGPNGWDCIKAILDDPQFEYILGNHDLFMIKSILGPEKIHNMSLWSYNGGMYTYDAYCDDELPVAEKNEYLKRLKQSKLYETYTTKTGKKIFLSHSGAVIDQWYKWIEVEEFVWDRSHFYDDAPDGIDLIVHGHTIITHLIDKLNEGKYFMTNEDILKESDLEFIPGKPFFYAHGTKCDIDCGTVISGSATLLDLDTLEAHPFFVKGWEDDFIWRD